MIIFDSFKMQFSYLSVILFSVYTYGLPLQSDSLNLEKRNFLSKLHLGKVFKKIGSALVSPKGEAIEKKVGTVALDVLPFLLKK